MRVVFTQGSPQGTQEQKNQWLENAIRDIAEASSDNNPTDIASAFTITGTFTETRNLNVTAPSLANIAAVLATLLADLQRGGQNRTL